MRTHKHASEGFTLIEIVVAISLLGLLIALAVGTIHGASRATKSGERLINATDDVRIVQEFMRRQISHAMPMPYELMEDNGNVVMFEGKPDGLQFVAPMPGYLAAGGAHVQRIVLEDGAGYDDGQVLVFSHWLLNGYDPNDPPEEKDTHPTVILEDIDSATFEYRSLEEDGELSDWVDEWPNPQYMPVMMRLKVTFKPGKPYRWPDLTIPLTVASSTVMPMNLQVVGGSAGGRLD